MEEEEEEEEEQEKEEEEGLPLVAAVHSALFPLCALNVILRDSCCSALSISFHLCLPSFLFSCTLCLRG